MILGYVRRAAPVESHSSSPVGSEDSARTAEGCRTDADSCTTLSGLSLSQSKQLPLPFADEQLCILRFPNHGSAVEGQPCGDGVLCGGLRGRELYGSATERRRSGLWRRGKVLYVDFGSGGECA